LNSTNDHEYAVLGGVNRTSIGRYLAILSSSISAGLVFVLLQAQNFASSMGLHVNLPPIVLSLAGAGAVYTLLFWVLNNHAWKWRPLSLMLKVPNLAGTWDCKGESLDRDGNVVNEWTAEVAIVQCWDRLRVRLKSSQSGSNSMAAALTHDSVDGWLLLYQYRNDPKIGEPELRSHVGACSVTFSKDLESAAAEYFNGVGRATFGRMTWNRRR
jgi:SMODS-associating 2TM, beta-strand rich effector domain